MRYFVIAPDGSKYGPADVPTLKSWIAQGRIAPNTVLEEESSRQRVEARLVAGLFGGEVAPYTPPPHQPRHEQERGRAGDSGNFDVVMSYICSSMSIICCGLFIIGGFSYASRAISKGNRGGYTARIVAIIFLILYCIFSVISVYFFRELMEWGKGFLNQQGIDLP